MSDLTNYGIDKIQLSIEKLESLGRPLPGPLNNMLNSLQSELKRRINLEIAQATQNDLVLAMGLLRAAKALSKSEEIANKVLGRKPE